MEAKPAKTRSLRRLPDGKRQKWLQRWETEQASRGKTRVREMHSRLRATGLQLCERELAILTCAMLDLEDVEINGFQNQMIVQVATCLMHDWNNILASMSQYVVRVSWGNVLLSTWGPRIKILGGASFANPTRPCARACFRTGSM